VIYQLLAQGRWVSAGPPASPTTKTGRHAIAEILLTVALKHQKSNQISQYKILISHGRYVSSQSVTKGAPLVHYHLC
jgi:hypothetical protein